VPDFLINWSRTRVIGELLVAGPRSIILSASSAESEKWLEPVIRITRRVNGPLSVEAKSLFLPPGEFGGPNEPDALVLLRTSHWNGERDKQASKETFIIAPPVEVVWHQIPANQLDALNADVYQIDQALADLSFPAEGLWRTAERGVDSTVRTGTVSTLVQTALWRRTRFQTMDRSWRNSDPMCGMITGTTEQFWETLGEKAVQFSVLSEDCYCERYDEGSSPAALQALFRE